MKDAAFIQRGFSNWKDATEAFCRHEASKCHQDAVQVMIVLPKTTRDIGETLSSAHMKKKEESRKVLVKIIQNIKFLSRQGIALRGHDDAESNFTQHFKLVWSPVHSKERSGDWASHRSEHWNVEGGANVAAITFSWACGTQTMATCNCVICGSNLPSCKERRVLYSRESCHVVSTAVELLRECVPSGIDLWPD